MIGNSMQTILITGINGFLGSHLAKAFSNVYDIIGLEYGLDNLHRIKDCNYKVYDVRQGIPKTVFTEQHIDIIIHAATFYGRENESAKDLAAANLFIPFELLDLCINYKCSLFINTDTVLDRFISTYALTKRHFQEWLYLRKNEIKVINMQLEHFYGPGASENNFISSMMKRLLQNEPFIDLTAAEQKRDFVFIEDVVNAYQAVLYNLINLEGKYLDFEVANGNLIPIRELLLLMKNLTDSNTKLNFGAIPYRANELMESTSNNAALRNLGWQPKTNIKEGLIEILSSFNKLY
jgi:CDP-paratose synthetase